MNYVFQFVAKVAQKVAAFDPDVIISALAYHNYYFPPDEDIIFPDNVSIMACKMHITTFPTRRYDGGYYRQLRENL